MEKTTIQVNERTLALLRKLKVEVNAGSYDETINKLAVQRFAKKSMAGSLKKYRKKGQSFKEFLKDLRDENDRY